MRKRTLGVLLLLAGLLLVFSMLSYQIGFGAAAVILAWVAAITTIFFLLLIGLILINEDW